MLKNVSQLVEDKKKKKKKLEREEGTFLGCGKGSIFLKCIQNLEKKRKTHWKYCKNFQRERPNTKKSQSLESERLKY